MSKIRYKALFKESAVREFKKLPKAIAQKISDAVHFLQINPFSELLDIKKVKGRDRLYRLCVGDFLILYEVGEITQGNLTTLTDLTIVKISYRFVKKHHQ